MSLELVLVVACSRCRFAADIGSRTGGLQAGGMAGPATSAAGFAAPWNLIQASSVAIGLAWQRARPSSRRSSGARVRHRRKTHPLVGRWDDQRGQGRRHSQREFRARSITILGCLRTSGMHGVWRALGARRSARQHLDRRCDSACRVQDDRRTGKRSCASGQGHVRRKPVNVQPADRHRVRPNGDLYVTDGYGGARVVKFSRDGKYLLEWGKRGNRSGRIRPASQRRG